MNTKDIPFWLVWNPNGNSPQHKHWSKESAEKEADRLAIKHPGQEFYVLQPIYEVQKITPLERTRFADLEMPF